MTQAPIPRIPTARRSLLALAINAICSQWRIVDYDGTFWPSLYKQVKAAQ